MNNLVVGAVYRHFKGNLYKVIGTGFDSETMNEVVIYLALYDDYKIWVRNKEMFLSKVDKEKYPEIKETYRFTKID